VAGADALLEACRPRPGRPDRRGWEWSYLKRLTGDVRRTLPGEDHEYIEAVTFSQDGRLAAAAGYNPFGPASAHAYEVLLWDASSGRRLLQLSGERHAVYSLAISPDGRTLAAGSAGEVTIWDLGAWRPAGAGGARLPPPRTKLTRIGKFLHLAFSPDSRYLAVGGEREPVRIWRVESGDEVHDLAHEGELRGLAFLPDGLHLATSSTVGEQLVASIWDLGRRRTHHDIVVPVSEASRVRFSPDGRLMATAGHRVRIWELATGRLVNIIA
jgi:WD40 repeat protein